MHPKTILSLTGAASLVAIPTARAHHGQDFLVALDADVPDPWHATVFSSFEWSKRGDEDELSIEPGFMAGIGPGLALGTSVRFAEEESSGWDYSSVDPTLQWKIPTGDFPVSFALSAGYVFAEESGHSHGSAGHHHHEEEEEGGVDPGPDGPGPGGEEHEHDHGQEHDHGSHSHGGIHRHGEDHFHLRFIADTRLGEQTRLVVNLIGVAPGSGEYDFGYAIGLRHQFTHAWAAGVENIGDFNVHGENEVIAGLYWTPVHACTIRLGAGAGIGQASSDFSLRSGVTWRF
ncbi:hypothetical protein [Luteolibacter sp. Populi]|uniref:hypothetical protein n=1 Tax=Luteolibacter sp. Populi TaxID=3230487 RepID=UPI0034667D3F